MLKKAKAGLAGKHDGDSKEAAGKEAAQAVLDSSRQIWLAGLGAFSRVQAEGTKVFESLVKQGEVLETRTKRAAVDTAAMAQVVAKAKVKEVQQGVGGTWDKLEHVFENRVERALSKLGVYTKTDMERLTDRVDVLSEAVNELIKATGVKPKRRPAGPQSAVERMVKGAVSSAAKTASGAVTSATGAVSSVTRSARKTVRTATRIAKATMK
jgi:poly(hydroxyalkanoate) granule-associated protein